MRDDKAHGFPAIYSDEINAVLVTGSGNMSFAVIASPFINYLAKDIKHRDVLEICAIDC